MSAEMTSRLMPSLGTNQFRRILPVMVRLGRWDTREKRTFCNGQQGQFSEPRACCFSRVSLTGQTPLRDEKGHCLSKNFQSVDSGYDLGPWGIQMSVGLWYVWLGMEQKDSGYCGSSLQVLETASRFNRPETRTKIFSRSSVRYKQRRICRCGNVMSRRCKDGLSLPR